MANRNLVAGCVLMAFSLTYAVLTAGLPERSLPNTPGPAFFPWFVTTGLLILSVALLIQGQRASRSNSERPAPSHITSTGWIALGAFVVYLLLVPLLGFLTASIPFFAVLTALYGQRNRLLVAVSAIAVPVLVYVVFRYGFQMLLPRGLWL